MIENSLIFTSNTSLVRNNNLFSSAVDDELMMMDEVSGNYFGLNPIAAAIWQLLEKPMPYSQLIQILADIYDVTIDECEKDTQNFLSELLKNKLINVN